MASAEVPISSYIHLAPDNSNGDKPLSNEEFFAQMTDVELEKMYDMEPFEDIEVDENREKRTSYQIEKELLLVVGKEPTRQKFVTKPGSNKLTRLPHKHTWGEEGIAAARKHERAQNFIQPGWIRRIPIIESEETTSIPVHRVETP